MEETWAIAGVDLHLDVGGTRVRAALESALRDAVRTGRLRPGLRLPSSRALAKDLGIARNTVADAYGQLVAEGWLTARQGAGTHVAATAFAPEPPRSRREPEPGPIRFDLRAGTPNLSAFPRAGWLAAARRAMGEATYDALGYSDPQGRPELRHALADYLARARGVSVTADRIVICSGFRQGLVLLCQVLRARGAKSLATEAYSHRIHRDIAAAAGLTPTALAVDEAGAVVSELAGADAALLTPAHQFPLGPTLAAQRRTEAVRWAIDTGALIVEDDYDGEFRYDRPAVGAMQALAPEHVVYAGTASKSLAPGIRVGWLVLPAYLVEDVVAAKVMADGLTSALDQLTMAELIVSGAYDRHVRRSRLAYRRRRDQLAKALAREVPQLEIRGAAAGLHALLELPEHLREEDVVARAARHGVAVEGLDTYHLAGPRHRPALVVGYGTPPEHAFTGAVARLCAALAAQLSDGSAGIRASSA